VTEAIPISYPQSPPFGVFLQTAANGWYVLLAHKSGGTMKEEGATRDRRGTAPKPYFIRLRVPSGCFVKPQQVNANGWYILLAHKSGGTMKEEGATRDRRGTAPKPYLIRLRVPSGFFVKPQQVNANGWYVLLAHKSGGTMKEEGAKRDRRVPDTRQYPPYTSTWSQYHEMQS